jgi:prepilin-type processing-associated H-X9-DG protein
MEEVRPKGYMPYSTWREPSRAAIVGPSRDSMIQRGYAREGDDVNIEYRHEGEANILFLDSHVEQFKKGDDKLFDLFDHKEMENTSYVKQVP